VIPDWNRHRCKKEGVCQTIAARGYHEVKNEWIECQANKNEYLKAKPVRYGFAEKLASENIEHRAEQSRRSQSDARRAKRVRRRPHQQGVQDMIVGGRHPYRLDRLRGKVKVREGLVNRDRFKRSAKDRPRDGKKSNP
jgi:hypothetical protein